jgi:Uma2 family endonuclease
MTQAPIASPFLDLPLRRWTVEDYHRMIAAGVLTGDDRVELIRGQIITMAPQDPPHASNTSSFGNELVMIFAGIAWVRTQLPITLSDDSEPEPDIAIVRLTENRYRYQHPQPEDVFVIIEVADSTLSRDRGAKAQIYAQAGIPEYWIVDVKRQELIVLREPEGDQYLSEQVLNQTDTITLMSFPTILITLQNLLV